MFAASGLQDCQTAGNSAALRLRARTAALRCPPSQARLAAQKSSACRRPTYWTPCAYIRQWFQGLASCAVQQPMFTFTGLSGCSDIQRMQGTYPLDTLRLRLAVDPGSSTMRSAAAALLREGSQGAFFRGLGTGLAGAHHVQTQACVCSTDEMQICWCLALSIQHPGSGTMHGAAAALLRAWSQGACRGLGT